MMEYLNIERLKDENELLKEKLIDVSFKMNYSKETELLEFVRDLYNSLDLEDLEKLSKEDIVKNLKNYIEKFMEYNKLDL